jgi:hypothetical protein
MFIGSSWLSVVRTKRAETRGPIILIERTTYHFGKWIAESINLSFR